MISCDFMSCQLPALQYFKYDIKYFARCNSHIFDLKNTYNPKFFRIVLEKTTENEYLAGKVINS